MKSFRSAIAQLPSSDLVLRLSALVAVAYGTQSQILQAIFIVCAGAGLVYSHLLRRSEFWFVLVSLSVFVHGLKWIEIDNHKWLFVYWMLAIGFALRASDLTTSLAQGARLLIGGCFACALFWKIFGGQYVDGSFLWLDILTGSKFQVLAPVFSGLDASEVQQFKDSFELYSAGILRIDALATPAATRLDTVALGASYFTLFIEGAVALTFLLGDRIMPWVRHTLLLVFIVAVYPIATVPGFACILLVMGLADIKPNQVRWREMYLLCLAFAVLSFAPKNVLLYTSWFLDFMVW